jgi:LuxR family maltose regulon positive regulatory protein
VATLHQRASAWYEAQGLVIETIQHALAGQDWERTARAIEEHGLQRLLSGQHQTVLGWINTLPAAVMQLHPLLCIIHALGLMGLGQLEAAEAQLNAAQRSLQSDAADELACVVRGSAMAARGSACYFVGDLAQAISLMRQALALLPEATTSAAAGLMSAVARATAAAVVAVTFRLTGDVTAASERWIAEAIAPMRATGNLTSTLIATTYLAYLHMLQGRLHTATATYTEVERLVPGQDALQALVGSPAYYVGMGELLYEWNNLDAAADYLARGMELIQGRLATDADVIVRGYWALAQVQQARGQGAAAGEGLEACMRLVRERRLFPLLLEGLAAMQARLCLMQGDRNAAINWAVESGLSLDQDVSFPRETTYLILARIHIATGQPEAALPLLERQLADAKAKARMHSAIEILTLQALAYDAVRDRRRALLALEQALTLAAPEEYVRNFVDEGAPMAKLLRAAAAGGIAPAYVERLLAALPNGA